MGTDLVDPADLMDSGEVADQLGLSSFRAVSGYRARYTDFPAPVVDRPRCKLWLRQDIERWQSARRG
jgi:hypothetical protein